MSNPDWYLHAGEDGRITLLIPYKEWRTPVELISEVGKTFEWIEKHNGPFPIIPIKINEDQYL